MKKLRVLWEKIDCWWWWNTSRDHNVCETDLVLPGGPGAHHRGYTQDWTDLSGALECIRLMILDSIRRRHHAKIKAWFMKLIRPRIFAAKLT